MSKRPILLILVSLLFIVVGIGSLSAGVWPIIPTRAVRLDSVIVTVSGLTAILSGVFMLRGTNWARWLCIAWLGFHLVVSFWHNTAELAVHTLFLAVIAFILFWTSAAGWFGK